MELKNGMEKESQHLNVEKIAFQRVIVGDRVPELDFRIIHAFVNPLLVKQMYQVPPQKSLHLFYENLRRQSLVLASFLQNSCRSLRWWWWCPACCCYCLLPLQVPHIIWIPKNPYRGTMLQNIISPGPQLLQTGIQFLIITEPGRQPRHGRFLDVVGGGGRGRGGGGGDWWWW